MPQFFASAAVFSGVHDPKLDTLFSQSDATDSTTARARIFQEVDNLENQQADAVFMYSRPFFDVTTKKVTPNGGLRLGNNLSTIRWEYFELQS